METEYAGSLIKLIDAMLAMNKSIVWLSVAFILVAVFGGLQLWNIQRKLSEIFLRITTNDN